MSIGNLPVGAYATFTAGQAKNIKSGQGALLGFYATAAGSMSVYDDPATGTSTPIASGIPLAAGWNALPVAFANGCYIALTTSAGTAVFA